MFYCAVYGRGGFLRIVFVHIDGFYLGLVWARKGRQRCQAPIGRANFAFFFLLESRPHPSPLLSSKAWKEKKHAQGVDPNCLRYEKRLDWC